MTMDKTYTQGRAISHDKLRDFVLAAILSALIIVMTVVPYTGYITVGIVEITTLHIVVALGAVFLGWKYGAILGAVWGITCLIRAFTNPLWIMFTNPLISVVPRILVGAVGGWVFAGMQKTKAGDVVSAIVAAIAATLTNTVLVLSSMYAFGGIVESYAEFFEVFKSIFTTIISLNGVIELVAAAIIVPLVYKTAGRVWNRNRHKGDNGSKHTEEKTAEENN